MFNYILQVKNLTVELDNQKIIDNLSFKVKKGDFLTIIGPNGSGKTVLLKTLLGLIRPYKGEITWQKEARVGYLPQGLTQLKVKGLPLLVKEFLSLKKNYQPAEMNKLLDLVGLNDKKILNQKIANLSGGQFQRMLLVWALASKPNVLLFDEPTAGIDVSGERTVYSLLRRLQQEQNLTILLITHDLNVVYKYSSRVLCISPNNVCQASPQQVLLPQMLEEIYHTPVKFYEHEH